MSNFNFVDRDYSNVSDGRNDSRRKEDKKIKLSEISRKHLREKYSLLFKLSDFNERREEKLEEKINELKDVVSAELKADPEDKMYYEAEIAQMKIKIRKMSEKQEKYRIQREKNNRRALKLAAFMEKNILSKFGKFTSYIAADEKDIDYGFEENKDADEMNVEDINTANIRNFVDEAYNSSLNNGNNADEINVGDINAANIRNFVDEAYNSGLNNSNNADANNGLNMTLDNENDTSTIKKSDEGKDLENNDGIKNDNNGTSYSLKGVDIKQDTDLIFSAPSVQYVPLFDNSEEEKDSKSDNDEINIPRPRDRFTYETDEEYNTYLAGFYPNNSNNDKDDSKDYREPIGSKDNILSDISNDDVDTVNNYIDSSTDIDSLEELKQRVKSGLDVLSSIQEEQKKTKMKEDESYEEISRKQQALQASQLEFDKKHQTLMEALAKNESMIEDMRNDVAESQKRYEKNGEIIDSLDKKIQKNISQNREIDEMLGALSVDPSSVTSIQTKGTSK